jgi:hypothetical protein
MRFLPEYKESAHLALELAQTEVTHLAYTHRTLFAQTLNLEWVQLLHEREDQSEKIDAFVSRFGRLQDHIGEKLIPRFSALLGESPKSLLDVLAYAERMGWIDNVDAFVSARKLRNLLVHEYLVDAKLFLEALQSADKATLMLISVVNKIAQYAKVISLTD